MQDTPSPLEIRVSPFVGRTYHSTRALPEGTCILDVATPYAYTIYKQFRSEVCAECWRYDGGRRAFLTSRELGESAGLWFCDDACRQEWLAREGEEMATLLAELEAARVRKVKGKSNLLELGDGFEEQEMTEDLIAAAWRAVQQESAGTKALKQWRSLRLDDFEADLARYVLMALFHYARERHPDIPHGGDPSGSSSHHGPGGSVRFGMASWTNFAALQSGELKQVRKFPELLSDHIRIYQVLKSRFNTRPESSELRTQLAVVITPENVRTALSVDPGNSFGIWEVPVVEESEVLGFGVYPVPSFFNHHCSPNVRKVRAGRRLQFVIIRDIGPQEELCISYGHVDGMSVEKRQEELEDGWFFRCQCSRCRAEGFADSGLLE